MADIQFSKMHGLGNDFMVVNAMNQTINWRELPILQLADRHLGIGFDQLLLIENSNKADFFCRILNADSSEAEQCGNGLRCVARYLHEQGIHPSQNLTIETKAGVFPINIEDYDHISIMLGVPSIEMDQLVLPNIKHSKFATVISTGNPHAIVRVDQLEAVAIEEEGGRIAAMDSFPHGVNVGFMQVVSQRHARLRTLERGAGETAACGSNACAAAVAGITNGWLDQGAVEIEYRFGSLLIEWMGEGKPIRMTGPASQVYSGLLSLS